MLIVLAVGLPWVCLVEHRHPGFIRTAFNHEIKDRAATGLEGHKGWPGYYLVSIWPTFLPWSLVLPLALVTAWKRRREPHVRFALAAVAGPWLMFEVVQTKLPHYLLPCFPPLAFLAADAILQSLRPDRGRAESLPRTPLPWRPVPPPRRDPTRSPNAASSTPSSSGRSSPRCWGWRRGWRPNGSARCPGSPTAAAVAGGRALTRVSVVAQFYPRRPGRALAAMGAGMLGLALLLFGVYLPTAPFLRLSIDTAPRRCGEDGATGPGQVVMLDYKEPSLAFYQGGTIREETALIATDVCWRLARRGW